MRNPLDRSAAAVPSEPDRRAAGDGERAGVALSAEPLSVAVGQRRDGLRGRPLCVHEVHRPSYALEKADQR